MEKIRLTVPRGKAVTGVDGTFYPTDPATGTIEVYSWHLPALYKRGYTDYLPQPLFIPPAPIDAPVEDYGHLSDPLQPASAAAPAGQEGTEPDVS